MKKYKLLNDLPGLEAGAIIEYNEIINTLEIHTLKKGQVIDDYVYEFIDGITKDNKLEKRFLKPKQLQILLNNNEYIRLLQEYINFINKTTLGK